MSGKLPVLIAGVVSIFLVHATPARAVNEVGTVLLHPVPASVRPGDTVQIDVRTHAGNNHVNVVYVRFSYDPQVFSPQNCAASGQFQGLFGQDACVVTDGQVVLRMETTEAKGPTGEVSLASVTMTAQQAGASSFVISGESSLVLQDADGRSVDYPVASSTQPVEVKDAPPRAPVEVRNPQQPPTQNTIIAEILTQLTNLLRQLGLLGR